MIPLSEVWLAGFFDGEGCIHIAKTAQKGKTYQSLRVLLAQSGDKGKAVLDGVAAQFGGRVYEHVKPGHHKATKSAYKWYLYGAKAAAFLRKIEPHLKLKQQQAQDAIHFVEEQQHVRRVQDSFR